MVTSQELRDLLAQEPFRPFRVHLTAGRTYDVLPPAERNRVWGDDLVVAIYLKKWLGGLPDTFLSIGAAEIDRIEMIQDAREARPSDRRLVED